MTKHHHRILTTKGPFEFSGCAYPERCDPRSHDASFISYCVCGMVRLANVGSDAIKTVERGPWIPKPEGEGLVASRRTLGKTQTTEREVCPTCGHTTTTVVAETAIARAIFTARRDRGLTLRQAADKIGVSTSTVCRVERGKMPDVESAVRIAAWLGESLDALFGARARRSTPPSS